jgi:hypothetical protein
MAATSTSRESFNSKACLRSFVSSFTEAFDCQFLITEKFTELKRTGGQTRFLFQKLKTFCLATKPSETHTRRQVFISVSEISPQKTFFVLFSLSLRFFIHIYIFTKKSNQPSETFFSLFIYIVIVFFFVLFLN